MKKLKNIAIVILIFNASYVFCQNNIGTIKVNENYSATLMFKEDISLVVVGNNPQISTLPDGSPIFKYYDYLPDGKTVIFRSKDEKAPKTSLTIKLESGRVWYGTIAYDKENVKTFYDFTIDKKQIQENIQKQKNKEKEKEITRKRLEIVKESKIVFGDIGVKKNKIFIQVTNIMNDSQHTYISMIIENRSANEFVIEGVLFKHIEGKRKNIKKKEAKIEERIIPVLEDSCKSINAYTSKKIGYVIPLFTTGKDGKLIIQVLEKEGTRDYILEVSAKEIINVKVF